MVELEKLVPPYARALVRQLRLCQVEPLFELQHCLLNWYRSDARGRKFPRSMQIALLHDF